MELELCFDHLADDVVEAEVDVQLLDLGTADAPAEHPGTTVGSVAVSPARPSVRVTVDLPVGPGAYEPGLLVRVRGRTARDEPVEFLNTSTTTLPAEPDWPVQVVLSRIR